MMNLNLGDTQLILAECRKYGCSIPQTAYILATARWETAHTMKPVMEAFWLSDSWRKRNLRYYPWHGRGYVQLTWEANYKFAGGVLGRDLTTNPDVVMQPAIAAEILVRGSMEGWFTAHKLPRHINEGRKDYVSARRVINGTDKARDIADMAEDYEAALIKAAPIAPPATKIPASESGPLVQIWAGIIAAIAAFFWSKRK